jgi:replicative DNA helicase
VGVATGYMDLDYLLGGLQRCDLGILAARTAVGKTTLALNIAYNAAITFKQKVGIFSLEMSATQLMERFVSIDSGMDQQKLRTGRLEEEDWPDLVAAGERLSALGIWIDDQTGMPLIEMRSRARRWVVEQGVELIIVDYLQLIDSREEQKRDNREQEVSRISRGLKNVARELNIPVLALAQLSRAVESRQSKVPQLSDLRESGSIEQEADVVMFIYRDEVYNPETERPHQADIIVAKHRAGPQGTVTLYFDQEHLRFANLDMALDPDGEEMVFAAEEEEGVPEVLISPPEEEDGEVE